MSTIRANSITDSAGTGAPDFPNGVSVGGSAVTATAAELNVLDGITAIASQAEAEAGTSSTTLMTPQRAKQAIDALVGSAIAGLSYGAVGTYAWLVKRDSVEITAGSTYSGASLVPGGAYIGGIAADNTLSTGTGFGGATGSGALSGTWRAHGSVGAGTNYSRSTLFLRIA